MVSGRRSSSDNTLLVTQKCIVLVLVVVTNFAQLKINEVISIHFLRLFGTNWMGTNQPIGWGGRGNGLSEHSRSES